MDITNNKYVKTGVMIGGIFGFVMMVATIAKSKPVADFMASVKGKV